MKQPQEPLQIRVTQKQIGWFLAVLILFAALLRLMVAYHAVHFFDLSFYVDWSAGVREDFFGAYEKIGNLDYPPLFLFPLYLTGVLMENPAVQGFVPYQMLVLKGWQILFDLLLIPLLYFVLRGYGEGWGLGGAALWAANPTAILNSSYWGQTDSIMLVLLLLAFWLLERRMPLGAGVVMALACLMKFQSLYFAPLFVLALATRFRWRQIVQAVLVGAAAGLAVFFPFMLRSGWTLPWEVYFGGFSQYPGASLNAFNLYTARGMNYVSSQAEIFSFLRAEDFSCLMIGAALAGLAVLWFTAGEKSVWLMGFWFMQTIFLFTTRMHERYQIPVLVFGLAAAAYHRSRGLFACHAALVGMTFLNHFLVIDHAFAGENLGGWQTRFRQVSEALSHLNLLLYLLTLAVTLYLCYRGGAHSFLEGWRAMRADQNQPYD